MNVFRLWSRETFLRVRVQFVECRDALMQILVHLDRDKKQQHRCIWQFSCCDDKRVRSDLRLDLCLLRRLPIELTSEERLMVGLVLFFIGWPIGLASERQTDSTGASEISAFDKKEASLKKIFFSCFTYSTWMSDTCLEMCSNWISLSFFLEQSSKT